MQNGFQNRGIADIELLRAFEAVELDSEGAVVGIAACASEKLMKNGIAVKSGQAPPNDFSAFVDESADPAISDKPKIEITHAHGFLLVFPRWLAASPETRQRRRHESAPRYRQGQP